MNENINDYLHKKRTGQKKEKKTYRSFIRLDDGKIAEQIVNPDPAFVVYDPATDNFSTQPTVQIGTKYIYPLEGDLVTKGVIRFPRKPEEYTDTETLRQEIKKFIHQYVDINPFYEEIASYYVLLTWLFDKNTAITYLGIFGDTGSGKTRAGLTIGSLCYKPALVSGSLTCAPIYRILEESRGTLIINEFDFKESDLGSELIKILNNGYEKGMHVLRSNRESGKTEAFDAFSPKIFTYRKKKKDNAFESRLITITIEETTREDIPVLLPPSFEEEAAKIRDKLLLFRFRNYHKEIIVDQSLFTGLERRLRQTLYPLLTVIDDPAFLQKLKSFLQDVQEQQRTDRGLSWVADYLQCLVTLTVENDVITVNDLAKEFNKDKEQKDKVTPKKVSVVVRNEFRFKTDRLSSGTKKGQAQIKIIEEKLKALCQRYNIEVPQQSSPSSPSSPQDQPHSDDSEDGEGSKDSEDDTERNDSRKFNSNYPLLRDDNLIRQEKELREKLPHFEKSSREYDGFYHQWFSLREEGESRGLWNFVPSPME